jgi:hypothetical protein
MFKKVTVGWEHGSGATVDVERSSAGKGATPVAAFSAATPAKGQISGTWAHGKGVTVTDRQPGPLVVAVQSVTGRKGGMGRR